MNPAEVYQAQVSGVMDSDIRDHLPRLRQLAKGRVLEIGTRHGISTAALIMGVREHGGHIFSLDIDPACAALYADDPQWTFIHGHSVDDVDRVQKQLMTEREVNGVRVYSMLDPLGLLFIDSDHSFGTTLKELRLYEPLVARGGKILLHDVDLVGVGVREALDTFAREIHKTPVYWTGSYGLGELTL